MNAEIRVTEHAGRRMRDRRIPPLIVKWLREYGAVKYNHREMKRYFDRNARKRLAADVGAEVVARMGNLLNTFLVETHDALITVGHRIDRIKNR